MVTVSSGVLSHGKVEFVQVQVALYKKSFPQLIITGLPSQSVRESKERVLTAFREMGLVLPRGRYVVHLQPATIKKEGTWLDGAIWLGLYLSAFFKDSSVLQKSFFVVGELGLDGSLFAPRGSMSIVHNAFFSSDIDPTSQFIFPRKLLNAISILPESKMLFPVINVRELQKTVLGSKKFLLKKRSVEQKKDLRLPQMKTKSLVFSPQLVKACELILTGGHSLLLFGSPGQGKTFLHKNLQVLLPDTTPQEKQELILQVDQGAPDSERIVLLSHTSQKSVLQRWEKFGNRRIFVLDELPVWKKQTREFLHRWLEISSDKEDSPTRIIATANPCPCGFYGENRCRCIAYERQQYMQKISGPLLDRFCFHLRVGKNDFTTYDHNNIIQFKNRVSQARKRQEKRAMHARWPVWSQQYNLEQMKNEVTVPEALQEAMRHWSLRRETHFFQVAYTLCDIEGENMFPLEKHLWEAFELVQPSFAEK